jgi:hypothetical protein
MTRKRRGGAIDAIDDTAGCTRSSTDQAAGRTGRLADQAAGCTGSTADHTSCSLTDNAACSRSGC